MKRSAIIIIRKKKWMKLLKRGRNHKKNIYPGTLSISNSTPSLAKTNNSLVKGTGIPLGNNWGFIAIFSLSIKNQIKSNQISEQNRSRMRIWFVCEFYKGENKRDGSTNFSSLSGLIWAHSIQTGKRTWFSVYPYLFGPSLVSISV